MGTEPRADQSRGGTSAEDRHAADRASTPASTRTSGETTTTRWTGPGPHEPGRHPSRSGLADRVRVGILEVTDTGKVLYANPAALMLLGAETAERLADVVDARDRRHLRSWLRHSGNKLPQEHAICRVRTRLGRALELAGSGDGDRIVVTVLDADAGIPERLRTALTTKDTLTGLLTRPGLDALVVDLLRSTAGTHRTVAALHIDVAGLDAVRIAHGPAAGDVVLRTIARRLAGALPSGGLLARGDGAGAGFTAVVIVDDVNEALPFAHDLQSLIGGTVIRLGADAETEAAVDIGVALNRPGVSWTTMMRSAIAAARAAHETHAPVLFDPERPSDQIAWLQIANSVLLQERRHADKLARYDERTGLLRPHVLEHVHLHVHARTARTGHGYGMLLLDLDRFGAYNSEYGYETANEALREIGDVLRRTIRMGDMVFRYGGEEFLVLSPGLRTGAVAALGERIRLAIAGLGREHTGNAPSAVMTATVACVAVDRRLADGNTARDVRQALGLALLQAKQRGERDHTHTLPRHALSAPPDA